MRAGGAASRRGPTGSSDRVTRAMARQQEQQAQLAARVQEELAEHDDDDEDDDVMEEDEEGIPGLVRVQLSPAVRRRGRLAVWLPVWLLMAAYAVAALPMFRCLPVWLIVACVDTDGCECGCWLSV